MIKFELIKAGDVLYDVHREKMGNTNMSRLGCWEVKIESVDPATRSAMVRWNWNQPERWHASQLRKLRRSPPKGYGE